FVDNALSHSPLLSDYRGQVLSTSIDSELLRATYKPQVNGTSNNSYAPVIGGYGYDGAITNGANINALVGVNKAIVSKKYLQAQLSTFNLQSQGLANTAKISEQDLKKNIIAQYITAYGDWQQLKFTREIHDMLSREDTVLKRLTASNVYRQTDYLTFLVTLQQQSLAVQQTTLQFRNDYAMLNYLCGLEDTTVVELEEPGLSITALPQPENSVFFQQYTIDSLKLRNQRDILDFSYKPKVSLFADAGYNSSLADLPYKNFGTSFGFSVTVPIYDGKQRKMQYRKLDISERTRQGYLDFFNRQYRQQINQLLQQLSATQEMIAQINNQIKYSEGLIQVNLRLLVSGDVKVADLVIAINNYLTSKNLLTQNTVSRLQIINQINYWNR
ncbi:MAG: TolC family protein, partial [Bacteroidetes bacterium]|nr:TolC family protein [Bacteroidota bacterium]